MSKPAVVFRTSVGPKRGLGHLRRCMTLAQALGAQGMEVHFAVDRDSTAMTLLRKYGFDGVEEQSERDLTRTLESVEQCGARVLVVDSYAFEGESLARIQGTFVAVLDDLADRFLPVDLVVNGAVNARELAYRTSPHTTLLLGPEYTLLREEFSLQPKRTHRGTINRVLVSVGGTDRFHLTSRLTAWAQETLGHVTIDVVIGPFFPHDLIQEIELLARKAEGAIILHRNPPSICNLMAGCDLAIAGGGQTTYELAATGTPTLAINLAHNQLGNVTSLAAAGTLVWVGGVDEENLQDKVAEALTRLVDNPEARLAMSRAGCLLVDGLGAKRVAKALVEISLS